MKRTRQILGSMALLALIASTASAILLADFEMNDPAGTKLAQLVNEAPGGGNFNYGETNMLADGNGLMVYDTQNGNEYASNYAKADLAIATNSGIYRMKVSFDSATLSSGGSLTYAVRDDASGTDLVKVQFLYNNDRLRLVMQDWGHVDNITDTGVYSLTGSLDVEVVYDLDSDLATFSWVNGTNSGGFADVVIPNGNAEVLRNAYQPSGMAATDFIKVDLLVVETATTPEGIFIERTTANSGKITNETAIASFAATNGDYVVVLFSVNKPALDMDSIAFAGSAQLGTISTMTETNVGASSYCWYAPVSEQGTIDVAVTPTEDMYCTYAVYQIRSSTAGIKILGTAQDAGVGRSASTNIYSFASSSTGICVEAVSAYAAIASFDPAFVVDVEDYNKGRYEVHKEIQGLASMTNIWSMGTNETSISSLGIVFASGPAAGSPLGIYNDWVAGYPGLGTETAMTNNPDGDLLDNLAEYAFGGDPSDPVDQGYAAQQSFVEDGGSNYVVYVYAKRSDANVRGLTYSLEINSDLVLGIWTNSGYTVTGTGTDAFGAGFDAVTNRVPAAETEKFIRSLVEFAD